MRRTLLALAALSAFGPSVYADGFESAFVNPPATARPWVYWMFMDGNITREGINADLEAMKRAGIGGAIMLEVNVGIPRGPVDFMSEPWRKLIKGAIDKADGLGLQIALGAGPGWCGTGGPWVKPEQSMQHLVASETHVSGPARFEAPLPKPQPRVPFFGEASLTPELHRIWKDFYQDVVVLAFRTPPGDYRIPNVDEKALYFRAPYSSQPGVKPFLTPDETILPTGQCISHSKVVVLEMKNGRLMWDVPPGNWTVLRFGRTITGQTTRPAPVPGLGFESDKFSKEALDSHFASFVGTLLKTVGKPRHSDRGLTMVHFDSWEMSSQNWSERFLQEFRKRRGYDPTRFLPAMLGHVVDSVEISERFLWDWRRTAQQLVVENHAQRLKALGRKHGLKLSIEPYDLNPAGDLELGSAADVPQSEFWSSGYGFATEFSCFEAASIAHTMGRPIVAAESFTSASDGWKQFPGSMKSQGDWALCAGINRIIFHRYQHQPWLDRYPGMTFGPYGVHWERTQTWWPMVSAYHSYLARCQALLQRGTPVADILYLDLEGAPNVFRPPTSALLSGLPDKRGYAFDGCSGSALIERASVKNGRIVFPGGNSYRLLVLPRAKSMTPQLLRKVKELADNGATILGTPPLKSPSLENYPRSDLEVQRVARELAKSRRLVADPFKEVPPLANELRTAKWIWRNEGNPAVAAPVGKRYFRREVEIAEAVKSATLTLTADNRFELFVNGHAAGRGDDFHRQFAIDIGSLFRVGSNSILVVAGNDGDKPNPAGLIGTLTVHLKKGQTMRIPTDGTWVSASSPDGEWSPSMELGAWNMSPWYLSDSPIFPDVYSDYATTAKLLAKMKVPPDFESDRDLRYIHRRDGATDLYFVGNRTDHWTTAECKFRVQGSQPELWDPTTGQRRALPEFREQSGRTIVPLQFAPDQSYFIVFRRPARKTMGGRNFIEPTLVKELSGPWAVSFDPKWGGPERVTFDKLQDWSKRPEGGIRFYSGRATYRETFELPQGSGRNSSVFLDLGAVKAMARVRLNGKDLGVVWCAPWRVDITKALGTTGNRLEIEVANLWPNRLIGDQSLPEDKRFTWTTWSPYRKDAPLLPSGLLGPVRILTTESRPSRSAKRKRVAFGQGSP